MLWLITNRKDYMDVQDCIQKKDLFERIVYYDNPNSAMNIYSIVPSDFVVIAIRESATVSIIMELLEHKGLSKDRMLLFYSVFNACIPFMRADRVFANPNYAKYKCIVLGLSHAEVGIIPDVLSVPTANLAVSSQDLFYNYYTMRYVVEKYKEKLAGLKYVIIDMYKYNYFNYDVSLSKMASVYWSVGGYNHLEHHFSKNHNYSCSFEDLIYYILKNHCGELDDNILEKWKQFFAIDYTRINQKYFNCIDFPGRNQVVGKELIENYNYCPSNVKNVYENTIRENIDIFEKLLCLIKSINPDIKVFLVHMPMYYEAWERAKQFYIPWREEFNRIIEETSKHHSFEYIDWTEHELANEEIYWFDVEHLNYLGALRFSNTINDELIGK